jgi:predicted short-subunit dehydrogenase-like oxidoreductase (DUF2520 family)
MSPARAGGAEASRIARAEVSVGLVGPGRVGAVLAASLTAASVGVTGWTGRPGTRPFGALPALPRLDLEDLVDHSEVILLAVRDDQLPVLADQIARLRPPPLDAGRRRIAWHVSGRFGLEVLSPLAADDRWWRVAAAPAMTFSGAPADVDRLVGSRWVLTGDVDGATVVADLITRVGGSAEPVSEGERALFHAALSLASNHLGTLQRAAADLLRAAGVDDPAGFLRPLAEAALADAWSEQPRFTGPVSRGDAGAVAMHLRAIDAVDSRDAQGTGPFYAALTTATTDQALAAGVITTAEADAIRSALDSDTEERKE